MKMLNLKTKVATLLIMLCIALQMHAQSDGFFRGGMDIYENRDSGMELGGSTAENPTPVGSGLLVLTIAGVCYVALKRKSSLNLLLASAILLTFTQCKKEIAPVTNNGVHITLNAGYDNSKTSFDPVTGAFAWTGTSESPEYINVGGSINGYLGQLTSTQSGVNATFSGTINPSANETLYFFYLGKGDHASATSLDFSNQDGTLENVTNYHIAISDGVEYTGQTSFSTTLNMKMSIAYFDVNGFKNASNVAETVYLHGDEVYSTTTINYKDGTISGDAKGYINFGTSNNGKYVALIPSVDTETTLKFDSNSKTGEMTFVRGIRAGKYYSNNDAALSVTANSLPQGTLPGIFSVSATKKVRWSSGNLNATTEDAWETWSWRFAEHQYDYGVHVSEGISANHANTNRVSHFGWGTSGYNGQKPNRTGGGESSYGGSGTNYDWGVYNSSNIINGGGCTIWRTPSINEWRFFKSNRSTSSVNNVPNARYTSATLTIDDVEWHGYIFFPDDYYGGTPDGVTWGSINSGGNWNTKCTSDGWASLEEAGCLFLPAAGGLNCSWSGTSGDYWTSDEYYDNRAWRYGLNSGGFFEAEKYRNEPCSVRLVRDVE
ncbi:MAG: hypothetical protein II401_03605 [Bacteroidales bacterium]|nr:hypothetical protein [Bacteroidales bacterium]